MLSQYTEEACETAKSGAALRFRSAGGVRRKTAPARQKILVIEDDKSMHLLYKAILDNPAYKIVSAYDGISGLAFAEAVQPDLILLDVDLPGITGFFICKYLRTNPRTQSIPIIFISGLSAADDMVCGLEADASDYVTKPIKEDDLRDRVAGALRIKKTMDLLGTAPPQAAPHTHSQQSAHLRPQIGSAQHKLMDARMHNPWTRIGRVVEDLNRRFHG